MSPVEEFYKWVKEEEAAPAKKRRGRRRTVLTSVTGDTTKPTLGKKVLLS